ncbi:MAG: hypothetical protein IJX30_05145, partial [Clostridia bacterium]|nr:hypothetical protein [Clostridia bacterium]
MIKTRTMKTIIVSLLLFVMLFCGFANIGTMTAFAADEAATTTTEKNIMLGASHLEGGQASNIYFGTYQQSSLGSTQPEGTEGVDWIKSTTATQNSQGPYYTKDPIKWRVLSNADGKAFLLSDKNLDVVSYHETWKSVTWETSTIRSWLNGYDATSNLDKVDYSNDNFINAAFGAAEKGVIDDTTVVNDDNPNYQTEGGNNTTDKVFLLSIAEAQNTAYGFTNNTRIAVNTAYVYGGGKNGPDSMKEVGAANAWWLRSRGMDSDYAAIVRDHGGVSSAGVSACNRFYAVRPAFNLNLSSVFFTSAASGGKPTGTGLTATTAYTGNEYKLTLLDSTRNFDLTDTSAKTAHSGDVLSFEYTGATTGANEYISAMLVDANGAVVYYGQLAQAESASGTVSLTVPADIAYGNYTLKLFNEQFNGDYKTDYSSAFVDISLTVRHNYNNGICTNCGEYEPAILTDGVYQISNAGQLYWFAAVVNGGTTNANAVLVKDITINTGVLAEIAKETPDTSGFLTWTPIGNSSNEYAGTFDGNGHSISGIYINGTSDDQGLFGWVKNGTVKNVTVLDSYIKGGQSVGGVVGYNDRGTVQNCYNTGAVSGADYVGGVVGWNFGSNDGGTVQNCYNSGTVSSESGVGGVVGYNDKGTVQNCYNTGAVNGTTSVGGVVGDKSGGAVANCYFLQTTDINANLSGIGNSGSNEGAAPKTADQFASGEVAYLLQAGQTAGEDGVIPEVWGQDLDNGKTVQTIPSFTGAKVYYGYNSCAETATAIYTNDSTVSAEKPAHSGGTATCITLAKCEKCGGEYGVLAKDNHESEEFTYTADGDTITATYACCNSTAGKVTITVVSTDLTYDGTKKELKVESTIPGVEAPKITCATDLTSAGTHTASITLGSATATLDVTIEKATLTASDFTYTAPTDLVYNGAKKEASVTTSLVGVGTVTVKYYKDGGEVASPTNAGTYTVKIDVAEGDNYNAVTGLEMGSFEIEKATPTLTVKSPVTSVLPGNTILLTVTASADEVSEFTISAGDLYTAQGMKITVSDDAVIGEDEITVTVTSAATTNYNAATATITLDVGMADFSGEIADLETDIAELKTLIDSKADAETVNQKLNELLSKITALEDAKDDYEGADAALKAELEAAIETAKNEAIASAEALVNNAKAELNAAIATKADTATLNEKVDQLNGAIETAITVAKAYADEKDAALKSELEAVIETAKNEAIASAEALVNNAKAELNAAIATKADAATLNEKVDQLNGAIQTAITVAKAYTDEKDAALKSELEAVIEAAKNEAIASAEALVNNAKAELNAAIATKADTATLNEKVDQ